MQIFSIFPTGTEFQPDALPLKISSEVVAVMAFRSAALARHFLQEKGWSPDEFLVRELTLDDFDRASKRCVESMPNLTVLVKIMD